MMSYKFLYACFCGWTATFKMPLFFSNTGVKSSMPTMRIPPYTTIVGMLGNMVGRDLTPDEIGRIGFMFEFENMGNVDLEKLESYKLDSKKNILIRNTGTTNPTRREFLVRPKLHLYIENIELFEPHIQEPSNIPCLGRSQDLAWLETLENGEQYEIVKAEAVLHGKIKNTLIPFSLKGASGIIVPLADYYGNFELGFTRKPVNVKPYVLIEKPATITGANLFRVSNCNDVVIYMHSMLENERN